MLNNRSLHNLLNSFYLQLSPPSPSRHFVYIEKTGLRLSGYEAKCYLDVNTLSVKNDVRPNAIRILKSTREKTRSLGADEKSKNRRLEVHCQKVLCGCKARKVSGY